MNYKHMMIFMMGVLCYVANAHASQADATHKVRIKIECVPNLPTHQPFETNVELSPGGYSAMYQNTADWAREYLAIPQAVRFGVYIVDNAVNVFFDGKYEDACINYLRLREIAQANLDSWGCDVRNQHFSMARVASAVDAEKYNKHINVPFAHACVREYIKKHQDTFGSVDNVRRMAERNKIVQANAYLDKDVQDVWNMWVDQACICLHDRVRNILSGMIKSSSSLSSNDIWLCSYVCEREAGKKMIAAWMSEQKLSADQKQLVEQLIAGKPLADKNKSVPKEDGEQRTHLFESKISMLNKKLIFPALVCAAGGLAYYIYRYMQQKNNDAPTHEKCKQQSSFYTQ